MSKEYENVSLEVRCALYDLGLVGVEDISCGGKYYSLEEVIEEFREKYKKLEAQYDWVSIDSIECEDGDGNVIELSEETLLGEED